MHTLAFAAGVRIMNEHAIQWRLDQVYHGMVDDPVAFELSYFDETPYLDSSGLDYFGGESYDATPNASFMHTMSDIIMAGTQAGLDLQYFEERPEHISNAWYNVEASGLGIPMSYILEFRASGS